MSAILRAMASVPETCAASLAVSATAVMFAEGAGAAAEALAACVGVMTRACRVALCRLLKVCQPCGGLLGVACGCHDRLRAGIGAHSIKVLINGMYAVTFLVQSWTLNIQLCTKPLAGLLLTRQLLHVKDSLQRGGVG